MDKESRRIKIKGSEGTPVDMSNWYENQRKRQNAERERKIREREDEKKRIESIECPLCKSTDKIHHIKRQSNGIYGPGHSSRVTEDYLICKGCGIHYSDINK